MAADPPKATDKLTQLQDCFDQLAAQMFLSLHHIRSQKPSTAIPGQQIYSLPPSATSPTSNNHISTFATSAAVDGRSPPPSATPWHNSSAAQQQTLTTDLHELSSDLVKRYQQIDFIIRTLPGLGQSQKEQESRIRELNEQLKAVDGELRQASDERDMLVERVNEVISRIRRP